METIRIQRISWESGQALHGSIIYDSATDRYVLQHTLLERGQVSWLVVQCNGHKHNIAYIVFE